MSDPAPRPAIDPLDQTAIELFDQRVDAWLEPVRRWRGVDRVFHAASIAADFSILWHVIGIAVAFTLAPQATDALWFSALIGVESLVVNQGVKRLFRRRRPTETGDDRFRVRRPRTSSFPSGHASSAFFAAVLLTGWVGGGWWPLWFAIALVVALSRAVVRIHHPTDVIGGAVLGAFLADLAVVVGVAGPLG